MKRMPKEIKQAIRKMQKLAEKVINIQYALDTEFKKYGLDPDIFYGLSDDCECNEQTDGLSFVLNADGNVNSNIKDIEEIFLLHVNGQLGKKG